MSQKIEIHYWETDKNTISLQVVAEKSELEYIRRIFEKIGLIFLCFFPDFSTVKDSRKWPFCSCYLIRVPSMHTGASRA